MKEPGTLARLAIKTLPHTLRREQIGARSLLALRYPPAHRFVSWATTAVIGGLSRLTHTGLAQPRALVDAFLDRLAGVTLPARYFAEVFALLLTNWVMDCMCLAVAIRATGAAIPWQGLFLAYGAGAGAKIVTSLPEGKPVSASRQEDPPLVLL